MTLVREGKRPCPRKLRIPILLEADVFVAVQRTLSVFGLPVDKAVVVVEFGLDIADFADFAFETAVGVVGYVFDIAAVVDLALDIAAVVDI